MKPDIYNDAIVAGGMDLQLRVTIEECLELATALLRFKRGRGTVEEIAEEVADVEIMCTQIRCMMGNELIDTYKKEKLKRLRYRINTNQMVKENE
jgi:NTP pyrophosphatase (non-canonical NTP hydrolase)